MGSISLSRAVTFLAHLIGVRRIHDARAGGHRITSEENYVRRAYRSAARATFGMGIETK
jgi:hypothetical protein